MKEQDKTLKQALQKAANEGAIAEDPSVEITPSVELDKKMNAFFDYVESRNTVGCHHHENVVADAVNIAHFTMIHICLTFEVEVGAN